MDHYIFAMREGAPLEDNQRKSDRTPHLLKRCIFLAARALAVVLMLYHIPLRNHSPQWALPSDTPVVFHLFTFSDVEQWG